MSDDEDFIRAILAQPDDPVPRLIYADWLEERGDPRGEFLRIESELTLSAEVLTANSCLQRAGLRTRLRELRHVLDPAWLTQLDRTRIENCPLRWRFACPRQWQQLQLTGNTAVRYCGGCDKNVHYCRSVNEARAHSAAGRCVAVDSRIERSPGDLISLTIRVGVLAAPDRQEQRESRQEDQAGLITDQRPECRYFWEGADGTIISGRWKGLRGRIVRVRRKPERVTVRIKVKGRYRQLDLSADEFDMDW